MGPMSSPQITCTVVPQYMEEHSEPSRHEYAWSYTVTIANTGDVPAQVVGRHWVITDATGHVEEVRGLAVVGHQPLLQPGEKFEYTSWTKLNTPQGSMHGSYICITDQAHWFDAEIPAFVLARAQSLH
jgi:ApaG protein